MGNNNFPLCSSLVKQGSSSTIPLLELLGLHVATCRFTPGATRSYNFLHDFMKSILPSFSLCLNESIEWGLPTGDDTPVSGWQRADMYLENSEFNGRKVVLDLTIVSAHYCVHKNAVCSTPGGAVAAAKIHKSR